MQNLEGIIAMLALLLAVGLPILTALLLGLESIKSKHRESMGLINQGIIPPDTVKVKAKANPNRFVSLRNGILLISLGVGLFVGHFVSISLASHDNQIFFIMASIVVFFIGIGYLLYFLVTKKLIYNHPDNDVAQD